ncbi:hypothetical protein K2224_14355 [Streptomyces sp. BHT-5-2]|uniref:hypothetical protein n=1 Tax=Streptomyces sp. BHT-5-2 TaxID=2866715 RepID=UPI001C8D0526|nr:hypothetical protein [Streptomyces sp. BHT-5-2]QZL04231.1 hypothetical protein K2224_14355 [Streptomyces sp. BHT-5-2]
MKEVRLREAVDKVTHMQFDRHGTRVWGAVTTLLDAERTRQAVGSVVVPFGTCSEPSNIAAAGGACPMRSRCVGCDHFSTDVYLDDLGEQVWRESGIGGPDDTEQLQARIPPSNSR